MGRLRQPILDVYKRQEVTRETLAETVEWFSEKIGENDIPSDGLVLLYDDIAYGDSLGRTAKFPRNSIAFKWADEIRETRLHYIEWSPSRTGLINPVAVFEPVELEGTTVSRASVHNISILESLASVSYTHLASPFFLVLPAFPRCHFPVSLIKALLSLRRCLS